MFFFELYRQLDIRMFQTMAAVDQTYGSCAKYVFDKDSLILLGMNHSIRLDILTKEIKSDAPIRNWDSENEAMLWFAEDSTEAAIVRLINDAYRRWLGLDMNITEEYFAEELSMINNLLAGYDLHIFSDSTGMSIFKDGSPMTFEQAIDMIMEIDENRMDDEGIQRLINEAFFYRDMDKYEEAAARLEKVLKYVDHRLPIYTDTLFSLAETYYFSGNYNRAVSLYYRVNLEFISNEDDFYLHLGHALLDERMKRYDRHLRIYYHSRIDKKFADTHRQAVAAAEGSVGEVFVEYEATCLDMGRKKFAEHKNHLPVGADDIDEILDEYEKPEIKAEPLRHKQYEGFKLVEHIAKSNPSSKSVNEQLAEALELFLSGDYQEAFDIYFKLKEQVNPESDSYTWIHFQLGKLYCIFDEPDKAMNMLQKCDPNRFGLVYRQDDFFVLYQHVHIVSNDFESDSRFRRLIRGRMDSYFAQFDREYNLMQKDRKLLRAYKTYEKDCEEDGRYEYKDALTDKAGKEGIFSWFGKKHNKR